MLGEDKEEMGRGGNIKGHKSKQETAAAVVVGGWGADCGEDEDPENTEQRGPVGPAEAGAE